MVLHGLVAVADAGCGWCVMIGWIMLGFGVGFAAGFAVALVVTVVIAEYDRLHHAGDSPVEHKEVNTGDTARRGRRSP